MKKYVKVLFSALLAFVLICGVQIGVQAATNSSNLLSQIEPYYTYRYSTGEASVAGETYSDCLLFDSYNSIQAEADFYLEGRYESLSFLAGHVSGTQTRTVMVYCDDTLMWEKEIAADDLPNGTTIDLTDVQRLRFVVSGSSNTFKTAICNMNLVSDGYTKEEREVPVTSNLLTNVQAFSSERYGTGDKVMGGKTFEDALSFNTYNSITGYATYNLQKWYKTLSFWVGNENNSADKQTRTVTVAGDGKVLYTTDVSVNDIPKFATIDVEGVSQLKITVSGTASYYNVVIGGANLVSDGVVRKMTLDQKEMKLSESNPSAYLNPIIIPTDAINQDVTWTSSDTNVATVNEKGLVTGVFGGEAVITATTKDGGYEASCTVTVDMPADFTKTTVTVADIDAVYDGTAKKPAVTVTHNDSKVSSSNYTVAYKNNINAGTATVTVTGKNNYKGVVTKTFNIAKANLSSKTIKLSKTAYTYAGGYLKPTVTVDGLTSDNYTVTYANNKNAGTATVTVTGKNNCTGSKKANFTIAKASISGKKVTLPKTAYTYTGKSLKPTVTISGLTSSDYTVTYTNNKKVGKATVTVKAKGNYTGTLKKTFKINPVKTSIKSLKKGKKSFTVKWSKKKTQVTGYQICYSLKSNFKSSKTKTITSYKTTSKKISGLKSKKYYYVRIRTYKTVKGVKYYSEWSKASKVKTK